MQWIKATDRMPEDWSKVHFRCVLRELNPNPILFHGFIKEVDDIGIEFTTNDIHHIRFLQFNSIEWLDENTDLSDHAKQKLEYITGHSIATQFPNIEPHKEWAGAVLDLLEELGLIK